MRNEHPDPVSETIRTYDSIAVSYCAKTRRDKYLNWEEEYIRKLLDHISLRFPGVVPHILDVGCGDGRHCKIMEKLGGEAIGIDLSSSMVQLARKYHSTGDFRAMDMRSLDFPGSSFHGIWSCGSIYHVRKYDVSKIVTEFRRVLISGGVVAVNFKLGVGEGLEQNPRSYGGSPRFFAYYTRGEMESLFRKNGFELVETCRYPEEIFGDDLQQMWFRFPGE